MANAKTSTWLRAGATAAALAAFALGACKGPMAKIEAVRDALVKDDGAALPELPACTAESGCLAALATALGSKHGFNVKPPDQAAAAAVAVLVARDGHGEWAGAPDTWMGSIQAGKGAGPDALRLAVARRMASEAKDVGKRIDDEAGARAMMKGIAAAIPGACLAYAALGAGVDPNAMALTEMPDHAPCVQKDLSRKDGPGGTYGSGVWRAAEGAAALWKDEARALRAGLDVMEPKARAIVDAKLADIDAASAKIELKKVASGNGWIQEMTEMHGDAGVPLIDAGAPRHTEIPHRPQRK